MDDLLRHAKLILRGMWLYRRLGVAVAWVVGIVAAGVILSIPDKYEASARIYVDTDSVLQPLLAGIAIQPNTEQQISVLSRTLISRPNVEKLIRMADLDLSLKTAAEKESLIDGLMSTLMIRSAGRDNLYTLSFRDPDPARATKIVQSLTTIFVESSLGDKRQDTDSAKKFIDEQIKSYEKKLDEAEARLKEFKLRNIELSTSGDGDSFAKIGEVGAKLAQARLDLREAENSRDAIKRQILGEDPVMIPDASNNSALGSPELDGRIETLKRSLDGLLQRYTEQHPDVVSTRRLIKELEDQKREEIAARRKAAANNPSTAGLSTNPIYQQLKISLTEAEASVASLRTRVAEYDSRYNQLKNSMKMLPQIEAELTQLNRDYEVHKKNYENLVARRESATISGDMESVGGLADFRLIDPPRASSKPVAPNRMLLLPAALLAALAVGAAACFVAAQVRPTFSDARSLREFTGLPFLGTVTLIVSPEMKQKERKSLIRFGVATSSLAVVYGLGMLVLLLIGSRAA